MIKNLAIVALLTTNLVFGVALMQRGLEDNPVTSVAVNSGKPPARAAAPGTAMSIPDTTPSGQTTPDLSQDAPLPDLVQELRAAGLPERLVRQMVLSALSLERPGPAESVLDTPYWRQPETSVIDSVNRRLNWQAEQRLMLVDLFGEAVVDDPLFAHLFRPLDNSLPFLTSDKQIALHELKARQDALNREAIRGGMTREAREDMMLRREEFDLSLSTLLSPTERFEYDLRESRAADALRRDLSLLDYSEQDFREIFAIRRETAESLVGERRADTRDVMEQRTRDYLGESRFEEYQRSQDPAFRSLTQIGERYGKSDAVVIAMYDETRQAEAKMRAIFQDETISREDRRARTETVWNETLARIESVAGPDAAASVRANGSQLGIIPRPRPAGRPPFARVTN
ncbi:MAG: hypothetical protein ACFHX7_21165 [Pseudomonadota bacterium]